MALQSVVEGLDSALQQSRLGAFVTHVDQLQANRDNALASEKEYAAALDVDEKKASERQAEEQKSRITKTMRDVEQILQGNESPLPWFRPTGDPDHDKSVVAALDSAKSLLSGQKDISDVVTAAYKSAFADQAVVLLNAAYREIERLTESKKEELAATPKPGKVQESSADAKSANFFSAMAPFLR